MNFILESFHEHISHISYPQPWSLQSLPRTVPPVVGKRGPWMRCLEMNQESLNFGTVNDRNLPMGNKG